MVLSFLLVAPAVGQEADAPADTAEDRREALRVFVDCQAHGACDLDFLRREIGYVNFVRDRQAAQVHVLITGQGTGGGGRSFTLSFIGREAFEGLDDEIVFSVRANLARERTLDRLARRVALGLARFVARTPQASQFQLTREGGAGDEEAATATPEEDPWNFWVFDVGVRGGLSGEERSSSADVSGSLSANRVTEDFKVELEADGSYRESTFELDDTTSVTSVRRSYRAESLVVWSLGPHWSFGGQASIDHSSFGNRELGLRMAPGIEHNLFRYEESERKQLTFLYTLGPEYFDWQEETVFGETSQLELRQRLEVSLNVQQPWGSAGGRFEASSFLSDLDRHRVQLFGSVGVRLTEGLSVNLFGNVARIQDQINIPAGDATDEEILLRIRELQTDFRYSLSVGLNYTFGSIYSNVVNPRF